MEEEGTLALASVVVSAGRPSDGQVEVTMPEAPDPDTLEVFHPPGPQGDQVVLRPIAGFPPYGRADTYSTAWVRVVSHRPVDYQQPAYLADERAPRSFHWSDGPRPSATMTMSVSFHATREELADVGDDYVLGEAFGVKAAWSISEEHPRLWSRQGNLLATSDNWPGIAEDRIERPPNVTNTTTRGGPAPGGRSRAGSPSVPGEWTVRIARQPRWFRHAGLR